MTLIIERLRVIESIIIRCATDESLREELATTIEATIPDITTILPAEDIKENMKNIIKSIKNNNIKYDELAAYISRITKIIISLDQRLPIGVTSKEKLSEIRKLIMDSLQTATERFKKEFPGGNIFDTGDTRIFITGSRARGVSHDGKRIFTPGRDVDMLLVGEGIFYSEIAYMTLKRLDAAARKSERRGFIAGFDRRFLPPGVRRAAEDIRKIFATGEKALGGDPEKVIINIHIGRMSSENVQRAIPFAIECV